MWLSHSEAKIDLLGVDMTWIDWLDVELLRSLSVNDVSGES